MAACLRGKTQILLGPKFKLELFYFLCLLLPLYFTHMPNWEEEKNSTSKRTRPFSIEDTLLKVNQFSMKL